MDSLKALLENVYNLVESLFNIIKDFFTTLTARDEAETTAEASSEEVSE